jgi:hypothetical protein
MDTTCTIGTFHNKKFGGAGGSIPEEPDVLLNLQ